MIHFFGNTDSTLFAVQTTKELSTKNKSKLITIKEIKSECLIIEIINAKKKGKLPKILVPVHFSGLPTDQDKIHKIKKRENNIL